MFGKLVVHPLAVFAALMAMPGLDPVLIAGGVIFASVPMMSIYPLLGARFGLAGLSAAALLSATVLSCLSITAAILLLERGGLLDLSGVF